MCEYFFKKEQLETYEWLKAQNLNTDDNTLSYWSRTYRTQNVKDVVNFAFRKISEGHNIMNIGGWVHMLLKSGKPIENVISDDNRKYTELFIKENQWADLRVHEKYVKDAVTGDDLPLTLSKDDFRRSLEALFRKSTLYKDMI